MKCPAGSRYEDEWEDDIKQGKENHIYAEDSKFEGGESVVDKEAAIMLEFGEAITRAARSETMFSRAQQQLAPKILDVLYGEEYEVKLLSLWLIAQAVIEENKPHLQT